jgi:hypothetical protein
LLLKASGGVWGGLSRRLQSLRDRFHQGDTAGPKEDALEGLDEPPENEIGVDREVTARPKVGIGAVAGADVPGIGVVATTFLVLSPQSDTLHRPLAMSANEHTAQRVFRPAPVSLAGDLRQLLLYLAEERRRDDRIKGAVPGDRLAHGGVFPR